jgi:TolB-like protein/DNA-binding winged helix-turn-helix (wHTH) protein/Flp pilus assembly protein TadD
MKEKKPIYEFGDFRLNVEEKQLRRLSGEPVPLPPKTFELLAVLVENHNRLLTKAEIFDQVWADSFVEEGNLKINIHTLRKILPDNFIETVPKHGYRFAGEVREVKVEPAADSLKISPPKRQNFWLYGAIILLIGLLGFGIYYFWKSEKTPEANSPFKANTTIAVLPFRHSAKDQEQLSLTLADALITKLAGLKGLTVRPTSSVLAFAENPPTPNAVQEKLKVENYLEGTIQKLENRLRISVQLVKTADGSIIWAENFNEAETDLLKLQDAISDQVVRALRFKISPQEQEVLAKRGTENDEAFRLYLQGRYFWNKRNVESLKKSIVFYEQALEKDAAYAMAYVGLANSYQLLGEYNGLPVNEAFGKSRAAAQKALEINPNIGEAHCSLGYTQAFYDWNWDEAEKSFQRALELSPNYATAHQWYGEYLLAVGKSNESLAELKRAQELDPLSLILMADIAAYYYTTRQFDKSIEQSLKVLEMDEKFLYGYVFLWIAYEQKGDLENAAQTLLKVDSLFLPPELSRPVHEAYQKDGWKGFWRIKYQQTVQPPTNQYFSHYQRALSALRLNDTEAVFQWLEKSGENRERWFVNLKYDPEWDKIREDKRFNELIRKANLIP